jgi:hypothetical protein
MSSQQNLITPSKANAESKEFIGSYTSPLRVSNVPLK